MAFVLPNLEVTASANFEEVTGNFITLPALTVEAYEQQTLSLPMLTVAATGENGSIGAGSAILPALTVHGADQRITLPALTVSGAAQTGRVGSGAPDLPMLEVAGVGLTGNVGSGEIELPALTVAGEGSRTSNVSLPALTVSAIGLNGRIGTANVSLPGLTVSGAASQIQSGSADGGIELPALEVVAVGLRGQIASASATLGLSVSAVGLTGTVATAAIELPMLTVDAAGYTSHTGSATITLPMLRVIGAASSPLPAVDADAGEAGSGTGLELAAGEALVLNLRNNAASTYDNYAFNSFATFNGVALGANADGIFALTGELDDTANIAATARMGVTDFNDAHLKRVSSAYVGYRTDGEAVLRVSVAEGEWFEYPLEDRDMDGAHGTRAKIGKGLKGRYWQAEVANVNGASLELDELELVPEKLSRRLG